MAEKPQGSAVRLPDARHEVIVHCKRFRCLGYFGDDGKWHAAIGRAELHEVIGWSEVSGGPVFEWKGK